MLKVILCERMDNFSSSTVLRNNNFCRQFNSQVSRRLDRCQADLRDQLRQEPLRLQHQSHCPEVWWIKVAM